MHQGVDALVEFVNLLGQLEREACLDRDVVGQVGEGQVVVTPQIQSGSGGGQERLGVGLTPGAAGVSVDEPDQPGASDPLEGVRIVTARMIPTYKTEDLLLGSWELIRQLGRVPRRLIWDNEPGIGRGQRRAEGVASLMGTLATKLVLLPPNDPQSKGIVERATAGSRPRSCPDGHFGPRRTSTLSSLTGWAAPTRGSCGP
jgi:hypothetical protein